MLSFHCNCRDHVTCPCFFVCLCVFFVQSILFSNIACKGFICVVSKYWKQVYFQFRSVRARRPFDRRSELMSNQYADVRFVQGRHATLLPTRSVGKCAVNCIIVKSSYWSDYVSRIDLNLLSFFFGKHCQCVEQRWKIILHDFTKLHAFIGNAENALRIIEKRCNAF